LDWSVFGIYFAGVLAFAWAQSRKNVGVEGYFLANRRLPWAAVGLSVMATQASAITFIGTTGQAFDGGMEFIQVYLKAKLYTAYEYLERRFDSRTRSLTAFLFLVSRGLAAGFVLYAPAIVLSVILGWDERATILVMGVVTILYTTMGGITAVIWTDVVQMVMMFVGIAAALVILFTALPSGVGVGDVAYIGGIHEMWRSVDLSWDLSNDYTIWSGMIGGLFLALAYFGTDQSQVQRFLTASSLKQSRLSLIFNAFLKVPMQFFILSIGVLLFVFYHFERPPLIFNPAEVAVVETSVRAAEWDRLEEEQVRMHGLRRDATLELLAARDAGANLDPLKETIGAYDERLSLLRSDAKELVAEVRGASSNDVNYVFPSYLIKYVPAGLLGLMIAVIFAAAMSSLDSELTALSSATVVDFYRRLFKPGASDAHYLLVSKFVTLIWGGLACVVALYAGRLGSLIEAVNQVGSLFYGSLLGVFLLGFLFRMANGRGAFWGLLSGMAVVGLVARYSDVSWLWYNVVGVVTVLAVGLTLSATTGPREPVPSV
jgi:Na+/proline symporter